MQRSGSPWRGMWTVMAKETADHLTGARMRILEILAFLAAALTTPLGMLMSYPYISRISQPFLGALLAFSAGALVYVGATHLLPQAETENKKYSLFALGAGVLVALIIVISKE